jgi:hypothetical protein
MCLAGGQIQIHRSKPRKPSTRKSHAKSRYSPVPRAPNHGGWSARRVPLCVAHFRCVIRFRTPPSHSIPSYNWLPFPLPSAPRPSVAPIQRATSPDGSAGAGSAAVALLALPDAPLQPRPPVSRRGFDPRFQIWVVSGLYFRLLLRLFLVFLRAGWCWRR